MKWKDARALAEDFGLMRPSEIYNNAARMISRWVPTDAVTVHLKELYEEAIANGVRFSKICGDAIDEGDSEEEACYICKNINDIGRKER